MGTNMISYSAFFDELEKIAEDKPEDRYVTKERLKRLAIAVPTLGAGLAIGHFGGKLLGHELSKHKGVIGNFAKEHPTLIKAVPATLGGLGAMALALKNRKLKDYITHGDKQKNESKRPKQ